MITRKYFAAGLGFAFVAAWIAFGLGDAVLCLIGAAIFYAVASFLEGDLDLADLQGRFRGDSSSASVSSGSTMRRGPRARVQ
jgi:hypothetical protein